MSRVGGNARRFEQACLETFFGLGLIVGPTLGGYFFQLGGYLLPFAVLGVLLIAAAFLTVSYLSSIIVLFNINPFTN